MEEKQYYKTVYNKFWVNQTKIYGHGEYTKKIVSLISKSAPKKVFEVAIGTGWPIGAALKAKGIEIDGCDIAETSVALAQEELGNKNGIWIGTVQEYTGGILYDVTYCVRSSWCIPDFYSVVEKMISMTKPGGYIIFDIMDRNSPYCLKHRLQNIKNDYYRFLGIDVDEQYGMHFISLYSMKHFLRKNNLIYQYWLERKITQNRDRMNTPKVVFCCRKQEES
ncbi:hypothetical protein C808_05037 [Lachnospiraceae bacterium M18-1]|nr:hypothetical protein C808_05037 [Lachnospiraceae bacterium M18-1]